MLTTVGQIRIVVLKEKVDDILGVIKKMKGWTRK